MKNVPLVKTIEKLFLKKRSESKNQVGQKLQSHLINSNPRNFWKCWNGCLKKSNCPKNLIANGLCEDPDIADYLAEEFKRTCTPNDVKKHEEFKLKYLTRKADTNKVSENVQMRWRANCK